MSKMDRAFWNALHEGRLRELRAGLVAGADPNRRGLNGERPLTLAARQARGAPLVKVLIEHGARMELMNGVGQTPLMVAAAAGRRATARLLLEAGTDADRVNRKKETALTYAVVWQRLALVELLLEHGADVELPPPPDWSPLMQAAFAGDVRAAKLLLRSGANLGRRDGYGRSVLMIAREARRRGVIRLVAAM